MTRPRLAFLLGLVLGLGAIPTLRVYVDLLAALDPWAPSTLELGCIVIGVPSALLLVLRRRDFSGGAR